MTMNHVALAQIVGRMTETLAPRGPDAEGVHVGEGVALGHRRLSILDLSPHGAQPMSLGEHGPTLVFNGEVYNFGELRRELEKRGHTFRGHSDSEVMLHTYQEWGLDGLKRFEGIFAFALSDPSKQRLVLMRDRLGVKPLYFSTAGDRLVFGSEIKSVLAAGGIDTRLDKQALVEYLWYGNSYEDRTIYRGVRALLPGYWLIIEGRELRIKRWWRVEEWNSVEDAPGSRREAADAVSNALDAAVRRQLIADVPIGIFLSGGVDSSAIAAAAMHVQTKPLASYSAGFDFGYGAGELPKASRVARHLGLEHHEVHVRAVDVENTLIALVRAHDEPFADAANIPLYLLARELRGTVKVVLQGDGGDEMFGGYRRYAMLQNLALWSRWPRIVTPVIRSAFGSLGRRFERMMDALGAADPAMRMALLLTTETLRDPPTMLLSRDAQDALGSATDPFLAYRRCATRFADDDPVRQMLKTDLTLQLPSQFLTKVDRATMACGIEARVPLLDEKVARLALSLPTRWKVNGTQKKIVLREAGRGRIPDDILDGPKTGFGVPYQHWLRSSLQGLARDMLLDGRFIRRFGFDGQRVEAALLEHRDGVRDRGFTLWKVLQLALWASEHP